MDICYSINEEDFNMTSVGDVLDTLDDADVRRLVHRAGRVLSPAAQAFLAAVRAAAPSPRALPASPARPARSARTRSSP